MGERGDRVLAALDQVAQAHGETMPAVALRWLADLLPMQDLELADDELQALDDASR